MNSPVQRIAKASTTGHGTNVIAGLAVGLESTGLPCLVLAFGILSSYYLGATSGMPAHSAGLFGTASATMGMLCTAVFVLAMNNFGPIADNAGGIVEMGNQHDGAREITDRLDAVGNVTKAATKGYAVGGSAMACFILFRALLDEISTFTGRPFEVVNIAKVEVIVGGLLGICVVFVFTGWGCAAVGSAAQDVVEEVRRQFKDHPGIMNSTEEPDYEKCVTIVTKATLREMFRPACLCLGSPVLIGFIFKWIGGLTGQYFCRQHTNQISLNYHGGADPRGRCRMLH